MEECIEHLIVKHKAVIYKYRDGKRAAYLTYTLRAHAL